MKFNTWTKGLAAMGIVSLASAAQADMTANPVISAVADTTISGYVDASAQWNLGTGNDNQAPYPFSEGKADGFNLNVAQISVSKPLDDSLWAAGYRVDLWLGPDAAMLGTSISGSDVAIRQAYVQVKTPIGYGDLSWKLGVFDTVIGYESLSSPNNPHYTRSYGFALEPTTHTGLLGIYQITENVGLSLGVADTVGPVINQKAFGSDYVNASPYYAGDKAESYKTYMGAVALSAPETWSFLKGSSVYAGFVSGFGQTVPGGGNQVNYYFGTTIATPVSGLQFGFAYDNLDLRNSQDTSAVALYASLQATEKMIFLARGEYLRFHGDHYFQDASGRYWGNIYALTLTMQYDLWQNVLSRVEFRWDRAEHGQLFGASDPATDHPTRENAFMLAANLIYSF